MTKFQLTLNLVFLVCLYPNFINLGIDKLYITVYIVYIVYIQYVFKGFVVFN
ncbi:hypothetical protein ACVWXS_003623 [Lysinibacillus sp. TE18511]